MDLAQIKQWISDDRLDLAEEAWLEAVQQQAQPKTMQQALEALASAGRGEMAATLAEIWLGELKDNLPPTDALEIARAVLPSLPANDELRSLADELYRAVHEQAEHFGDYMRASGLTETQSLRRAIQTLDVCLAVKPGSYLLNRFDHRVVRLERYNGPAEQFELTAADGPQIELEPKLLADEFAPAEANDFRVMCAFEADRLGEMLQSDPAAVLAGACLASGGSIEMPALKELLVPRFLDADKWSRWWSRARNVAKRSETLSLEGRHPTVISYHPDGRTLEDELAGPAADANMPAEISDVLAQYARQLSARKLEADPAFAGPLLDKLAGQVNSFLPHRPADALAAALAIESAAAMSLPRPPAEHPSAGEIINDLESPAEVIAQLGAPALWPIAYELLADRPDAAEAFAELLRRLPAGELDAVASRLRAAGQADAVEQTAAEALASPAKCLQLCLWLWAGPAEPVAAARSTLELLSRLLGVMEQLGRDWDADRDSRRRTFQQIRSALAAGGCAAFARAVDEMDEGVAATIRRRIELSPGLSAAGREDLLAVLRETHPILFVKARVEPWLDESAVWTTSKAFELRQARLKKLLEVTIPANARAIGAAAAHGDISDNSEWQYAIEERGRLQGQAAQMQNELAAARVLLADDVPAEMVGIGSRVLLKSQADGQKIELTFLGPWDTDVDNRIYSYRTPLAQALMGKTVGDVVALRLDSDEADYVIVSLASAL